MNPSGNTAMRRVCVFCGSSPGARPEYAQAARQLGALLATRHLGLVYGGANVGTMRELADAALAADGEVIGVIPRLLVDQTVAHTGLTALHVADTMHERKACMAGLADAFVALPGGLGTLDEFFEVLSWAQLGVHAKPCGLLNVAGYFDALLAFLDHAVQERFLHPANRAAVLVDTDPAGLLERLAAFCRPTVGKWLDRT